MFRNYLRIAFRSLLRHKAYAAINVFGLAIGVTCCILIFLFVRSDFSYDQFHSKADRIYRSWVLEKNEGQDDIIDIATPLPLAHALQTSFPDIETTCRILNINSLLKVEEHSFSETITLADSSFFNLFDFKLLQGSRLQPFPNRHSVILTAEAAKKYFGESSPVGKNVELQLGTEKQVFMVAGIAEKAPEESSIKYSVLIPFSNDQYLFSEKARKSWFNVNPETYVLLRKGATANTLISKLPSMVRQNLGEAYKEGSYVVNLQPITAIHLDTSLPEGLQPLSDPKYSYILLTIGILILLVACINFITLSVGRSATRALEVGVRKVMGAERQQLIRQFWGEAMLVTTMSILIGIGMAAVLLKPFNQIINRQLALHVDFLSIVMFLLLMIVIGFIAGIYPAMILSSFKPIEVLKGKLKIGTDAGLLRRSLITGQFVASITLIICTIFIGKQIHYLQDKDLGYTKEQVMIVPTNKPGSKGVALAELYRNELLKQPQVAAATISLMSFAQSPWISVGYTDDNNVYRDFQLNAVDPYFLKTMGIRIVQGRDFEPGNPTDYTNAMLVNETMAKQYGWKNAIGQKLPGKVEHRIIGIVKDFNNQSLHSKVQPLAMIIKPDSFFRHVDNITVSASLQPRISVLLKPGNLSSHIAILKKVWKMVAPDQEFEYSFLNEAVESQYRQEQRTSAIVQFAAALSIFIACMGLFGLATLTVVRRTKEIGIRKIVGASVNSIVGLLSKEFVVLITLASVISFPIAYWAINTWLQDFAYHIPIQWWVFPVAGVVALAIALVTVGFQTAKAALSNPVKSLRTE